MATGVLFRDKSNGETLFTLHPEHYDDEGFELIDIVEEPGEGQVWGGQEWINLEEENWKRQGRDWQKLPKYVRLELFSMRDRIEVLEAKIAKLTIPKE